MCFLIWALIFSLLLNKVHSRTEVKIGEDIYRQFKSELRNNWTKFMYFLFFEKDSFLVIFELKFVLFENVCS